MADLILRAAVVLCGLICIANSVHAQYGLRRAPHVLNLEDYDSDEVFPLARRIVPVPDGASFKRNYRSHNHAPMPMAVTPAEQLPLSDDLIEHLETLLRMAQQKKAKAAHKRTRAEVNQIEKQTLTTATPASTASEPMNRTTEASATGTPPTTTPASSREIGKKWFPVLLQEAIDNVLRQNDTDDELDELVDHIAAGSRTYRFEASPGERLAEELSEMFHSSRDNLRPMRREGPSAGENPLGSAVPYVVNVFNNTHIGYIVMKVSNDSEIIVQESQDEGDGPNNVMLSAIDFGRRARKIAPAPGVVGEELVPLKKSPLPKGYQKLTSHATFTSNPRQHPYGFKPQTPEPPFFNLLKSPEPKPVKYRVLLRNSNDVLSDRGKMRLPVPASIGRTKYQGRQSHGRGRPTVPKPALPVLYTQGLDAGKDQKRSSRAGMMDVSSVEFAVDTRPGHGRVVRRFDYESLEAASLPYEEAEFTYPDTVTEPTAKLLATGRHDNSLVKASSSERTRTTREPFAETRRYNLRRTFGPMDSMESLERHTKPATATSPTTTPEPDSFEEGELLHQPTTNVFLNAKKNFRRTGDTSTSRRRQRLGDSVENRSGPLKLTFDTKEDPLASLFEMDSGEGKRPYKKAAHKRVPWSSSEEVRDDSRS